MVKVDVTEHNDVTKRHDIVITIWRKSATPLSEMKGMQEKESSWVLGTDRKIRPSGITV